MPSSSQEVIVLRTGLETCSAAPLVAGMLLDLFIVCVYCWSEYKNFMKVRAASLFLLVSLTARPAPAWLAV